MKGCPVAELKNTFSLSASQIENFKSCPRKYWFSRYGSWGGWDPSADERTRSIYRQKQLTNVYLWTGDKVHKAIKGILESFATGQGVPDEAAVLADLLEELREDYRESLSQVPGGPIEKGTLRLIEHDEPALCISASKWKELTDRALEAVRGFYRSEAFKCIVAGGPEALVRRDNVLETMRLSVDGREVPVYVTIDVMVKAGEQFLILDWKTGKPRKDAAKDQLGLYALYVANLYAAPAEDVFFAPVYLAYTPEVFDPVQSSNAALEESRASLENSAREILARVADPDNGVAEECQFEALPTKFGCRNCVYRNLCSGYKDLRANDAIQF